jgi:hypothetical protein
MQAAIDGSYLSLTDSQQQLFRDLAVFSGGFDLDAARQVTHRRNLLPDLNALINKSMLKATGGDPRRYLMLETLRSYAGIQQDPTRAAQLESAHTEWVVSIAIDAYLGLRGPDCLAWTRRLGADMANIRAALSRDDTSPATYLEIVGNVYWFWYRRGHADEGMRMLEPVLTANAGIPLATRVRAIAGRAIMSYLAADLPAMLAALTRLGAEYAEFDVHSTDPVVQVARGDAAVTLAYFEAGSGVIDAAREHAAVALDIARRYHSPWTAAEALMSLGTAEFRAGDHVTAADHFAAALETARSCGYDWCAASILWIHAKSEIAQQRWGGPAEDKLAQMLAYCERADDLTSAMVGLFTLAYVLFRRSEHAAAAQLIGAVDDLTELTGYSPERMDIVELATFGAAMRAEIDPDLFEIESAVGRTLGLAGVRELVYRWAGLVDIR